MKLEKPSVSVFLSVFLVLCLFFVLGSCMEEGKIIRTKMGGVHDCKGTHNSAEIQSLGRFAIEEHNKKKNALLEFTRVLKAKEQVVAGKIYHLTVEAVDGGKKKIYEAKVWVKPWMNFKQLQEFKHVHDTSSFTISDIGAKQNGHRFGWQEVPIHDPEVKDAAKYAMNSLAQRSNSLSPYELLEIVLAKAKVFEDYVKLNLLLKVRRGIKEEMYRVEVNKNLIGMFYLSHMEQYYS